MATQSVLHRHDIDMQENNELLVDYASEHVPNMVMQVTNVWCWVNVVNMILIKSIVQPVRSWNYEIKKQKIKFATSCMVHMDRML